MRRKNVTSKMMKEYIAEALLILMEKRHYDGITIGEITEKAGVNRSTYYRHFGTKDSILKFYFEEIIAAHMQGIPKEPIDLEQYLLRMFSHYFKYSKRLLLTYKAKKAHLILDVLNEIFLQINLGKTIEKQFEIYYHTGGIYNTFLLWFENDMRQTPAEMTKFACSFLPQNFKPMLSLKMGNIF